MTLTEWITHEIKRADLMQSKHADHHNEIDNIETWAYFQGYKNALRHILEEVKKRDI